MRDATRKAKARATAKKEAVVALRRLRAAFDEWEGDALSEERHLWSNIETGVCDGDSRCVMLDALRVFLEATPVSSDPVRTK